jgi:hypothetical protein
MRINDPIDENPATDNPMKISDDIAAEIQNLLQQHDPNHLETHVNIFPIFEAFFQLKEDIRFFLISSNGEDFDDLFSELSDDLYMIAKRSRCAGSMIQIFREIMCILISKY